MNLNDLIKGYDVVDEYKIKIPTYVKVSKKLIKACNLNIYRNLHFYQLDQQKKNFKKEVEPLLKNKPFATTIWVHYEIFASRNNRIDCMNIGSVIDKYFSDVLVECGKIPDDNTSHLILNTFSFGGVCPMEGHAIATVNILKPTESNPMKIILTETDITEIVSDFIKQSTGFDPQNINLEFDDDDNLTIEMDVSFSGFSEEVNQLEQMIKPKMTLISHDEAKPETHHLDQPNKSEENKPKKKRRGRPKGSKNKPKPPVEENNTQEEVEVDTKTDSKGTGNLFDTTTNQQTETNSETSNNIFNEENDNTDDNGVNTTNSENNEEVEISKPRKKTNIFDEDNDDENNTEEEINSDNQKIEDAVVVDQEITDNVESESSEEDSPPTKQNTTIVQPKKRSIFDI